MNCNRRQRAGGTLVILATRNPHKLREVRQILRADGWETELRGLDAYPDAPEVPESGATCAENASAKALAAAKHTGLIAVADDSGLEVDALGGEPGVASRRFAAADADDAARIAKLLSLMREVAPARRTARFRCAVAIATPAGKVTAVEGIAEGKITTAPRGERGFGYDPVFVPRGYRRTFAQMTAAQKNRLSHRGNAFRAAAPLLAAMLDPSQPA